jgi:hypothetical protein
MPVTGPDDTADAMRVLEQQLLALIPGNSDDRHMAQGIVGDLLDLATGNLSDEARANILVHTLHPDLCQGMGGHQRGSNPGCICYHQNTGDSTMTETTQSSGTGKHIRDLRATLADLESPPSPYGTGDEFYRELEIAVRAGLAPLPDGETGRLAAEADQAARTMAPPVPDVTRNVSYTVRAVMPGHPAGSGLLASWWVAAESTADNQWVTWEAYKMDGSQAGRLAYNAGHYFGGPDQAVNKRGALADLAVRAGTMPEMARRIAEEVMRYDRSENWPVPPEDKRMAARLRKWAGR